MIKFRAFLLGIVEFRSSMTQAYDNYDVSCVYDMGRELAHRFTWRIFDENANI